MHRFVSSFCAAALIAQAAESQVAEGDLVLVSSGNGTGAFAIDPATGAETTLRAGFSLGAATMAHGNQTLIGVGAITGSVYRLFSTGSYTTVAQLNDGAATGIALDQDESLVLAQSWARQLVRIAPGGTISTLTSFLPAWGGATAICRDGDTGHFIVGFSDGRLAEVNRESGYKKTVATGLGSVEGVAYLPISGRYVVATQTGLKFVRRDGTVAQSLSYTNLAGVAVDPRSNWIYAVERNTGKLHTVLPSGTPLTPRFVGKRNYQGIAIWGSRTVSVKTSGLAGTTAEAQLRFKGSRRKPYCAALSFGNRPGIVVGNVWNRINLAADPLFFLTVCGGLPGPTSRFQGTTTISSGATASFLVPALPKGTVIYVGAVAVNANYTGGLHFMNSEAVRIE